MIDEHRKREIANYLLTFRRELEESGDVNLQTAVEQMGEALYNINKHLEDATPIGQGQAG